MKRRDRELVYCRHLDHKPAAEEYRRIVDEMQQHVQSQALRAGYPVHAFADAVIRRDGRKVPEEKRGWNITVKALVGHVV